MVVSIGQARLRNDRMIAFFVNVYGLALHSIMHKVALVEGGFSSRRLLEVSRCEHCGWLKFNYAFPCALLELSGVPLSSRPSLVKHGFRASGSVAR